MLLKYGADVHVPMSAGKDKKTPVILAAAHGSLDMVKLLFENGAFLEQQGPSAFTFVLSVFCRCMF